MPQQDPEDILDFWFSGASRARWFDSTPEFDAQLKQRFEPLWRAARGGRLAAWEGTPRGALALVIVLDQFPLNMYRDRPESFSTEAAARAVAERIIAAGGDAGLARDEKLFLYMPLMHSESLADQERSVALFESGGLEVRWARHHHGIVRRFGRFPHRNAILGRASTAEEIAWLASPEGFHG